MALLGVVVLLAAYNDCVDCDQDCEKTCQYALDNNKDDASDGRRGLCEVKFLCEDQDASYGNDADDGDEDVDN